MEMDSSNGNTREIKCPECNRRWPRISEQGVVTELIDKCYQCLMSAVITARDERQRTADHKIDNCAYCGGLEPARLTCISCGGKGWEAEDLVLQTDLH